MTQEEKQLLLKDLCARLPYGVKVKYYSMEYPYGSEPVTLTPHLLNDRWENIQDVKPYLRPMSSMTEEEKGEVSKLGVCYDGAFHNDIYDVGIGMEEAFAAISWLLERHFDINYLIHKGLALEAPEDMYNNLKK